MSERDQYRQTLVGLRSKLTELNLRDDPPTGVVRVVPGTDELGRPVGGLLPVYPEDECGTDDLGMAKVEFNLYSLIPNFRPRKTRR